MKLKNKNESKTKIAMKKSLLKMSLILGAFLWSTFLNAQADPNFTQVDTENQTVTITNFGNGPIDLDGYWLCLGSGTYRQIGTTNVTIEDGDINLAPNQTVTLGYDQLQIPSGGLGLFTTNSFGSSDPDIFVDFVQWGAGNTQRAAQAVTAGRWDDATDFIQQGSPYFTDNTGGNSTAWNFTEEVEVTEFVAILSGVQENPVVFTAASGMINATLTGNELIVSGSFEGLQGELYTPAAGGDHIHRAIAGRNGGIELQLTAVLSDGDTAGVYNAEDNTFILTDDQVAAINAREFYINIHSSVFTGGELRGQLLPVSDTFYQATLLGSNEVPSINTIASGNMVFELEGDQLTVSGSFDDLSSEIRIDLANGAHIHDGFAGRNGEVLFPLNPTYDEDNQGAIIETVNNTFTLNEDQIAQISENGFYINIHSVNFPAGELRGQILPIAAAALRAELTGFQEVPSISSEASGRAYITYDGGNSFSVGGTFNNLSGDLFTEAAGGIHLHIGSAGINGPIEFVITPDVAADNRNAIIRPSENTFTLNETQLEALLSSGASRRFYINIHSETFQAGELRGQVLPLAQSYFGANLSGQNEIPQPVTSTGIGNIQLELTNDQLVVTGGFSNLSSDFDSSEAVAGGAHLHLGDAASTGGIDIILNTVVDDDLRGGVFLPGQNRFTITEEQRNALLNGDFYVNLHTVDNAAGELRGQLLRDDNAFPIATTITSPANGNINIVDDSSIPYIITWDASTDPNGDLVVYTYQLSTDADFTDILINTNVGTALEYNVENSVVFNAIIDAPVNALLYQRVLASDGSVSTPSIAQTTTLNCIAEGGTISIDIDATNEAGGDTTLIIDEQTASICLDGRADPIVVQRSGNAESLSFLYVVTDDNDVILNITDTNVIDLDAAGNGTCRIWGWSYRGTPDNGAGFIGESIFDLDAQDCSDISDNFVTVIREEALGGTISIDIDATDDANNTTIIDDEQNATILVGDGIPNPIVVQRSGNAESLSFLYVITDDNDVILNITDTNEINLESVAPGTCRIWGWSYRGTPENGAGFIGESIFELDAQDCSDISDDFVTVVRQDELLATDDFQELSIDINVFPNPATNFFQVEAAGTSNALQIDVYDVSGRLVIQNNVDTTNARVDISSLKDGLYLVNVVDTQTGQGSVIRIVKR